VAGVPGGILSGDPGGVAGGLPGGIPAMKLSPPPLHEAKQVTPPEPPTPHRIQVSADIQEGKLRKMIRPEYPSVARMAHVSGTVHLKAIITAKGNVAELQILEGNPLLVGAALAAVEKWRYDPTLFNGEPVEVVTEVIVQFRLL